MEEGINLERPRVGRVGYVNCLPIFYAIESGLVQLPADLVADHPSRLNNLLASGMIEVTAVSSIAYAHNRESCVILPDLSIASDGAVWSVALLSRMPVSGLNGRRVSLTPYSATSVVLLQILLNRFYGVRAELFTRPQGVSPWWGDPDATLVIGDEALRLACLPRGGVAREPASSTRERGYYVYDLGMEWKRFTGMRMVFALWVARQEFAERFPHLLREIWRALQVAKGWGCSHRDTVAGVAARLLGIPSAILTEYFRHLKYELSEPYIRGLRHFYECARQCGLIQTPVRIKIWREVYGYRITHGANR